MASKNDIYGLYRVRLKSRVSHGTECTVYFVLPVLFCQGLLGSLNRTNEYGLSTLSVRLEQHTSMPLELYCHVGKSFFTMHATALIVLLWVMRLRGKGDVTADYPARGGLPVGNWVGAGGRDRGRGRNRWKGRWTKRKAAVRVYSTLAP